MWDASWMDPYRETVGQRRSRRKAKASGSKSPEARSCCSSIPSFSSYELHQRKPSLLTLFAASNLSNNRRTRSPKGGHRILESIATEQDEEYSKADKWLKQLYEIPLDDSQTALKPSPYSLSNQSTSCCKCDTEYSSTTDAAESIFSEWTNKTENTQSTWSTILSPKSPTKRTSPMNNAPKKKDIAIIPHECTLSYEKKMSAMVGVEPPKDSYRSRQRASVSANNGKVEKSIFNLKTSAGVKLTKTEKQDFSQFKFPLEAEGKIAEWKSPDVLDWISADRDKPLRKANTYRFEKYSSNNLLDEQKVPPVPELSFLQRKIRMMEAASSKIVLERLEEKWDFIVDGSIYRDLELEKQLWMLRALRGFQNTLRRGPMNGTHDDDGKVMSLYENDALASTLSALTNAKKVYHLAKEPLSPGDYPNVIPQTIAIPSSQIPYPSSTFTSISAYSIPYLFPASSIPTLLKECQRVLVSPSKPSSPTLPAKLDLSPLTEQRLSGGSLHLIILDPAPIRETIGPYLRSWLDSNLIIHLEQRFICIHPSRLFPVWLADAGLQAEGSKKFHIQFSASVPETSLVQTATKTGDSQSEILEKKDLIELQLKSVAGRMLWKWMWGDFVRGDKWWWDDKDIIQECEKLGTCWEYYAIEAIKE